MAWQSEIMEKEFSIGVSHQTRIDRMIHMTDVGFDEFTLTLIQSKLMIKELNHIGSYTERFVFSSDGLPLKQNLSTGVK